MNIVIKGADFSEVAIGNVGKVDRKSILNHVLFISTTAIAYLGHDIYKLSVFDISQYPTGQKFIITGVAGGSGTGNGVVSMFTAGTAPTQDITFASQSGNEPSVNSFKTNTFGTILKVTQVGSDDYNKLVTVEVTKPEGANSLYVNTMALSNQSQVDNVVVMEKNTL